MTRKTLALISIAGLAISFEGFGAEFIGNIRQADLQIGGSLSLSYNYVAANTTFGYSASKSSSATFTPSLEYFVIDGLSIGGTFSYYANSSQGNGSIISFGPSGTYYFATLDKAAFYIRANPIYSANSFAPTTLNYFGLHTTIGMNFFFNPYIAIGPGLQWIHSFSNTTGATNSGLSHYSGYDNFSLIGAIAAYL
jgi:hypothetical protein